MNSQFTDGERVEYWSKSHTAWITTVIEEVCENGYIVRGKSTAVSFELLRVPQDGSPVGHIRPLAGTPGVTPQVPGAAGGGLLDDPIVELAGVPGAAGGGLPGDPIASIDSAGVPGAAGGELPVDPIASVESAGVPGAAGGGLPGDPVASVDSASVLGAAGGGLDLVESVTESPYSWAAPGATLSSEAESQISTVGATDSDVQAALQPERPRGTWDPQWGALLDEALALNKSVAGLMHALRLEYPTRDHLFGLKQCLEMNFPVQFGHHSSRFLGSQGSQAFTDLVHPSRPLSLDQPLRSKRCQDGSKRPQDGPKRSQDGSNRCQYGITPALRGTEIKRFHHGLKIAPRKRQDSILTSILSLPSANWRSVSALRLEVVVVLRGRRLGHVVRV